MSEYSLNGVLSSTIAEQTLIELGGVPIDRVAWRVVRPGEHYERPNKLRLLCFDHAPPVRMADGNDKDFCRINDSARNRNPEVTIDLSGRRAGRLTFIGYWGKRKSASGLKDQLWACRCLCGLFTIRSAKLIKNNDRWPDNIHMCDACLVDHLSMETKTSIDSAYEFIALKGNQGSRFSVEDYRQRLLYLKSGKTETKATIEKKTVSLSGKTETEKTAEVKPWVPKLPYHFKRAAGKKKVPSNFSAC